MAEDIGGVRISATFDISDLESKFAEALTDAGRAGQQIGDAFAEGINSMASALSAFPNASSLATGIAKEIAQAFESQPISLNIDTSAAGSAAQQVAAEIGQALSSIESGAASASAAVSGVDLGPLGASAATAAGEIEALNAADDALMASFEELATNANAAAVAAEGYAGSAESIRQAQQDADEQLKDAQAALAELQGAYDNGQASANELARAADAVQSAFAKANPSLKESGDAANEAKDKFGEMAEKLAALGEALIITEGLREFGKAALEAADNVTRASIALTTITGSAEQAESTIKGLEQLGMSDGLSFPSLYTAGTRMQQLLGPGADVAAILGKIADGAAVMGTDIGAAATKFDMLVTSGNASAKALLPLGLGLQQIADALNIVDPALNATSQTAKEMFKNLDDQGRIAVLEQALSKLGGTAQQVAEQTFGGQWQILENKWELIMADVGRALMPVITTLTKFAGDVLDIVAKLVSAFNDLPEPVKDTAVAIGILAAAIVPVAAAMGGLALAIEGLGTLGTAAGGLLGIEGGFAGIGAAAALAAPEILAVVAAVAAIGLAVSLIDFKPIIQDVSTFVDGLVNGVGPIPDLIENVRSSFDLLGITVTNSFSDLKEQTSGFAQALTDLIRDIGPDLFAPLLAGIEAVAAAFDMVFPKADAVASSIRLLGDAAFAPLQALDGLRAVMVTLKDAALLLQMTLDQLPGFHHTEADAVAANAQALDRLRQSANDSAEALRNMGGVKTDLDSFSASVQTLLDKDLKLKESAADTKDAIAALTQAAKDGTSVNASGYVPSMTDVARITEEVYGKTKVLTPEIVKLAQATHDLVDNTIAARDPMQVMAASTDAAAAKFDLLAQHLQQSNANLITAGNALKDIKLQADAGAVGFSAVAKAEEDLVKAADAAAKAQQALNDAFSSAAAASAGAAWVKHLQDAKQAATDAGAALQNLGLMAQQAAPAISPLNQAMIDAGVNSAKAKNAFEDLHTPISQIVDDMGRLAEAARNSGDWSGVETAIDNFDKRIQALSKVDLPEADRQMEAFIQDLINAKVPTELVQGQLDKLGQIVAKMAKEDLPGAKQAWADYMALLQQVPQTLGDILQKQEEEAQAAVTSAERNGTAADQWILKLEAVKLKQEELRISADGLATTYVGLIGDVLKGWDNVAKSVADNIIDAKNWGQVWEGLLKNFAKSILETVIQGALLPLKLELMNLISTLLPAVKTGLDAGATGAKALSDAAQQAAKSAQNMSDAADKVTTALGKQADASGQGASGLADSLSHLTSIISVISDVISAGAAVASTIILSHISSDTGHIEVNTRGQLAEALNLRADLWKQHDDYLAKADAIYSRMGEMWATLQAILEKGAAGGGGLTDSQSQNLKTLADAVAPFQATFSDIDIRVASIDGWARAIDGDVNNGLGGILSYLYVLNASLDKIISAINYHGGTGTDQSNAQQTEALSNAIVDSTSAETDATTMSGRAIVQSVNTGTSILDGRAGSEGNRADSRSAAQTAALENVLGAARATAASTTDMATKIEALQREIAADNGLMDQAIRDGNLSLAESYRQAAANATRELAPLISATNQGLSQINTGMSNTVTAVDNAGLYIKDAGTLISTTSISNTAQIVNAVSTAGAGSAGMIKAAIDGLTGLLSTMGAWGATGGGLPHGQSGLPSGSGGSTPAYPTPSYNNPGIPNGEQPGYSPGGSLGGYNPGTQTGPGFDSAGYVVGSPADLAWQAVQKGGYGGIPGAYAPGPNAGIGMGAPPPGAGMTLVPGTGAPVSSGPLPKAPSTATGPAGGYDAPTFSADEAAYIAAAVAAAIKTGLAPLGQLQSAMTAAQSTGTPEQIEILRQEIEAAMQANPHGPSYTSTSGSTSISGDIPGSVPYGGSGDTHGGGGGGGGGGSSDVLAAAIKREQDALSALLTRQNTLTDALTTALGTGASDAAVADIRSQLAALSTPINDTQSLLDFLNRQLPTVVAPVAVGVKATADQITAASKNAQDSVTSLKTHLGDLNNALIVAESTNVNHSNDALIKTIEGQIGTTNSDLGTANGLLAAINSNIPAGAAAIGDDTKLTGDTIAKAVANEQGVIDGLGTKLKTLNTELINAIATDVNGSNSALIANIRSQIGTTNGLLSDATGLLKLIGGATAETAVNTAPKAPSNTPPSGTGPGSLIGNVAYSGMPLGYGYGQPGGIPGGIPHFADGGIMPWTGLAHMEAGEMAIPPDVSAMLRRMASTPDMAYNPLNPAAGASVPPGSVAIGNVTFNVYGGSAAENVRQISAYMKVVSPKMAALSS